jgi:hypothetical protein
MALSLQKLIAALLASLGIIAGTNQTPVLTSPTTLPTATISHKSGQVIVELAKTPASQQQGLSDRKSLGPNQGMLFIFPQDEPHQFWMKDMNFPLDIIWLNKDGKILGIATDVATSTFPNTIPSPGPIRQVLEVNAGYTQKYGLSIGDFIR